MFMRNNSMLGLKTLFKRLTLCLCLDVITISLGVVTFRLDVTTCWSVGWLVGLLVGQMVVWSICHKFLKGRETTLKCSHRSTCNVKAYVKACTCLSC